MRKAGILTLVLFLLLGISVGVIAFDTYGERDQVKVTEKVIFGDKEAVKNVEVGLHTTYKQHLFWDTIYMTGEEETKTEYVFSANRVNDETEMVYRGVSMGINSYVMYNPTTGKKGGFSSEGLGAAYQELYDVTEPGQEGEKEIRLKDYMDYYQFDINVDFPGNTAHLDMLDDVGGDLSAYSAEYGIHAVIMLSEYFKIPVREDETYRITIRKDKEGKIMSHGGGNTNSDFFYMYTYNKMTDNACYFTFETHTQEGKIVDTSHLPDGYGIYCLPYEMKQVYRNGNPKAVIDTEGFEMIYSLNPEIRVASIETNEDQSKLLLHAIEDEIYSITVIDIATREMVQKLEIGEWKEDQSGWYLYDEGNFMVITMFGEKLALVTLEDNGEYKLQFVCDIRNEEVPWFYFHRSAVDFDGEKLVMTGQLPDDEYRTREDTASFYLAVYEENGIVYYGEYQASLMTGTNAGIYNYHCRGRDNEPLEVRWVEK